jgi:hypothetical protein
MPAEAGPVATDRMDAWSGADGAGHAAAVVIAPGCGAVAGRSRWEPAQPAVSCHTATLYPPGVGTFAGKDAATVRRIRDDIDGRVRALLDELLPHEPEQIPASGAKGR